MNTSWLPSRRVDTLRAKAQKRTAQAAFCCMTAVLEAASARAPASPIPRGVWPQQRSNQSCLHQPNAPFKATRTCASTGRSRTPATVIPQLHCPRALPLRSFQARRSTSSLGAVHRPSRHATGPAFFLATVRSTTHLLPKRAGQPRSTRLHDVHRWVSTRAQYSRRHGEGRSEAQLLRRPRGRA